MKEENSKRDVLQKKLDEVKNINVILNCIKTLSFLFVEKKVCTASSEVVDNIKILRKLYVRVGKENVQMRIIWKNLDNIFYLQSA